MDIRKPLPETVYCACEDKFHTQLWKVLLKGRTVKQVAASLQLSSKQLYVWKEGDACYPLSSLNKLCGLAGMRPVLAYVKTRHDSEKLLEPKVEQELNEEFSEFLGHLLHDGGIDQDWRVHYTSNDELLLRRFGQLVEICFGKTLIKTRPSGAATTLYYPAIIGTLISRNLGLPRGSKVQADVSIPESIKKRMTTRGLIVPYVTAAFLCEGESGRARLALASKETTKPSKLLEDLRDLLERLRFTSARITPSSKYDTREGVHRRWVLSLEDQQEKRRLKAMVQDYRSAHIG